MRRQQRRQQAGHPRLEACFARIYAALFFGSAGMVVVAAAMTEVLLRTAAGHRAGRGPGAVAGAAAPPPAHCQLHPGLPAAHEQPRSSQEPSRAMQHLMARPAHC